MADGLSYEIQGIESVLQRLSPQEAQKALRRGMQTAVLGVRRELATNLSGRILKRRTGNMVGAIATEVQVSEDEVVGIISNTARWRWKGKQGSLLAVHEHGATIRPRQGASHTLVGDRIVRGGGVLRFEIGGRVIYTTKPVVIPARRPVGRTLEAKRAATVNVIRTALLRQLYGADKAPTANRIFGSTGATVRRARSAGF